MDKENDYNRLLQSSNSKSNLRSPNYNIQKGVLIPQKNHNHSTSQQVSYTRKSAQQNKMRKLSSLTTQFRSPESSITPSETYSLRQIYNEKVNDLDQISTNLITAKNQVESQILNNFNIESKFQYIKQNLDQLNLNFKDLESFEKDSLNNLNKKFEISNQEMIINHQKCLNAKKEEITNDIDNILKEKETIYLNQIKDKEQEVEVLKNKLLQLENAKQQEIKVIVKEHEENFNNREVEINQNIYKRKEEFAILSESIQDIATKLKSLQDVENPKRIKELSRFNSTMNQLVLKNSTKQKDVNKLLNETSHRQQQISKLDQETYNRKEELERMKVEISQMKVKLIYQESTRRKLHSKLQDLKGNIRVYCRIRSVSNKDDLFDFELNEDNLNYDAKEELIINKSVNNGGISNSKSQFKFQFDKIFSMTQSNEVIFEEYSQLIQSCIDGLNVCVFAYGQTGSGKTFTMSHERNGMIPLSLYKIFDYIEELKKQDPNWTYSINGKFLEIYNENIKDLLNLNSNLKYEIKHDDVAQKTTISNITTTDITSIDQTNSILNRVNSKRSTASTKSNDKSSRSHSIFIFEINGHNTKTNATTSGTLNLIDLAGSERISQSQVEGERLKETQFINKSLSSLGDVISSLKSKNSNTSNQHIPFRNSKLTYLLKHSLSGNSKTLMFVNISPLLVNLNETLNSLRFATKVNNTKLT
ncbi:KAR3 [Candida pseudojiufengensis]|uniref:KAR3 n=1 Tax=Candida pseudojiufengensis TaxID=497109 RepID=UPI0022257056|nr:KAR3 [Candida pseudojiufengensis]KAI5965243.1 KAR3 [Candida pseudojiufengensis]